MKKLLAGILVAALLAFAAPSVSNVACPPLPVFNGEVTNG